MHRHGLSVAPKACSVLHSLFDQRRLAERCAHAECTFVLGLPCLCDMSFAFQSVAFHRLAYVLPPAVGKQRGEGGG